MLKFVLVLLSFQVFLPEVVYGNCRNTRSCLKVVKQCFEVAQAQFYFQSLSKEQNHLVESIFNQSKIEDKEKYKNTFLLLLHKNHEIGGVIKNNKISKDQLRQKYKYFSQNVLPFLQKLQIPQPELVFRVLAENKILGIFEQPSLDWITKDNELADYLDKSGFSMWVLGSLPRAPKVKSASEWENVFNEFHKRHGKLIEMVKQNLPGDFALTVETQSKFSALRNHIHATFHYQVNGALTHHKGKTPLSFQDTPTVMQYLDDYIGFSKKELQIFQHSQANAYKKLGKAPLKEMNRFLDKLSNTHSESATYLEKFFKTYELSDKHLQEQSSDIPLRYVELMKKMNQNRDFIKSTLTTTFITSYEQVGDGFQAITTESQKGLLEDILTHLRRIEPDSNFSNLPNAFDFQKEVRNLIKYLSS